MKKLTSLLLNYFYIISISCAVGLMGSYALGRLFEYKIHNESFDISLRTYYINQLKDRYTLCILDYSINPNGKDMLKECEKIELKINLNKKKLIDEAPYYSFYNKHFR